MYLDLENVQYSASINNIRYTVSRNASSFIYNTKTDAEDASNWDSQNQSITVAKNSRKKALHISCESGIPQDDTILVYTVTALIQFKSGKTQTVTYQIYVMDDAEVVTSIQQALYTSLNNRWYAKYGEYIGRTRFYRSDLLALDGTVTFETTLTSIRSSNGSTILNYLPAIEGLNFSDCTSLTSTYTPSGGTAQNLFVFNHMPQLEALNVYNCSSLTEDIDLTMCDDLTEVDARGTSINVLIPTGSKITSYKLGTPTEISIVSPTVLQVSGVSVDDYTELDTLELVNIPGNKAFGMFYKIMS